MSADFGAMPAPFLLITLALALAAALAVGFALGAVAGARRARRDERRRSARAAAEAESRLALAERKLLAVLGSAMNEALLIIDSQSRLRYANRTARAWFDIGAPSADGVDSTAHGTRRRPALKAILRSTELHELVDAARDGIPADPDQPGAASGEGDAASDPDEADDGGPIEHTLPLRDHIYRVRLQRLDDGGVVISLRDDTEVERLARARRDLVANISHDLRTPLTSIRLLVESLLETDASDRANAAGADIVGAPSVAGGADVAPAPQATFGSGDTALGLPSLRKRVRAIRDQAAILERLADGLVQLNRLETGRALLQLSAHPLGAIVATARHAVEPQFVERSVAIDVDVPEGLDVLVDEPQIIRVLTNLLDNALHASRPGQRVRIRADRADRADGPDRGGRAEAGFVELVVEDQGPGIAPDDAERIFERFYRGDRARASSGSGLGLAIARHIVEGHGGRITLDRSYREGARFRFTVPRARPAPPPRAHAPT